MHIRKHTQQQTTEKGESEVWVKRCMYFESYAFAYSAKPQSLPHGVKN